ncbi:MAG TPA: glycosyltransferase [Caulobacteraceae bacterium]|nr:glycosyltransferase [Caulobacteraceae bacterium]
MISVIIPAHNESNVIGRCVEAILADARPGELEIIVATNGCTDRTAEVAVAAAAGGPLRVVDCPHASKPAALNAGDAAARGFPRAYVDADIIIDTASLRAIAAVLDNGEAMVAASTAETRFLPRTSWAVRAFYAFWQALPYVRSHMIAAGVYAIGSEGRRRFDVFPPVVSDDGFIRLQFSPKERVEAPGARSIVTAPTNLGDLIRIRTRSRAGWLDLRDRYPQAFRSEARRKNYLAAFVITALRPRLIAPALIYVFVVAVSRMRAGRLVARGGEYQWERDLSSRGLA